jgi:hypothetical protein
LVTRCVDFVVLEAAITYDTDDIHHGNAAIDVVLSDLNRAAALMTPKERTMNLGTFTRGLALAALTAMAGLPSSNGNAQEMDLSRIGAFESLGTGTVHGGAPPKTLVDDDQAHAVVLTIWNSEGDSKVSWKPVSGGEPQTTVIHGTGVHAFQTDGLFKIQAIGEGDHEVQYGYVVFRLRKD